MRGRPRARAAGPRGRSPRAEAVVRRLASTSARCSSEVVGHVELGLRGAAGGRRRRVRAPGARRRRSRSCSPRRGPTRRTRATPTSGCPTRATPSGSRRFFAGDEPTVVYFGKLIENKGVQLLLEALAALDARAVIVGFGDYRAELERLAAALPPGQRALHRAARAPPSRPSAAARRRRGRARRSSRRRSGWSPPRPPPAAARRSSPATPVSPRSPPGSRPATRRTCAHLAAFTSGDAADLRAKLAELLALPADDRRGAAAGGAAHRRASAGRGRASPRACSRRSRSLRGPWARNSAFPRRSSSPPRARRSRTAPTSRVAVEEEFALLDPETLALVEPLRGASRPPPRAPSSSRTSSAS